MTNRRKHPRVTIKAVTEVLCVNDDRKFKAFVGGISRGGLELSTHDPIDQDCRLELTLHFVNKSGKSQREKISGMVRWFAPFDENYISGIEFSHVLDKADNPALTEYLANTEENLKKFV